MGWLTAIAQIIRAIPQIIKLLKALFSAWAKAKARKDLDDFEDRFKDRNKDEKTT